MSYKMDYRSLKNMEKSIKSDIDSWNTALSELNVSLNDLINSREISGKSADSVKLYVSTIHQQGLIPSIGQLIQVYIFRFCEYYNDYVKNLDTDVDARFHEDEFDEIKNNLINLSKASIEIEDQVISTLNSINDIFRSSRRDVTYIIEKSRSMKTSVERLDSDISSLESSHASKGFSDITSLIKANKALISELKFQPRNYKTGFDANSFAQLKSAKAFIDSNVKVSNDLEQNKDKYIEAYENTQEHVQALDDKERAERERIATAIKIGVAVVTTATMIIVTAGTAAPLIIGAASACTAIATTATNGMLDEYVEKGNLDEMDWGKLTKDSLCSGAAGFITGYVGGGVSKTLKEVGPLSKLVGSENPVIRVVGKAAVGSVKDIIGNAANEGAEWAKSGFKEFHAERIIGIKEGEDVNLENIGKAVIKTGVTNLIEEGIGEAADSFKEGKSGFFNSGNTGTRVLKNAFYGATKEIVSGGATRGFEAFVDETHIDENNKININMTNITKKVLDGQEIVKDGLSGGITDGYEGAKNPSQGKEIYQKNYYYTKDSDGNVVKVQNKDGSDRYRIDRNDTYENVQTPKGIEYDRQYIRDGGKITADSNGNVIYENPSKIPTDSNHPIKSALKKNFVYGDGTTSTEFYDSNGNLDTSRSANNYTSVSVGKINDVLPDYEDKAYCDKIPYQKYSDTLWSATV